MLPLLIIGWADNYHWYGELRKCSVLRQCSWWLDKTSISINEWSCCLVFWSPSQDPWTWELGLRFQPTFLHLVGRLLQPSVVFDRHYAVHGSKERVALRQNVLAVWCYEEKPWGLQQPTKRRRLRPWLIHGRSSLGHPDWTHSGIKIKGAYSQYASHIYQGYSSW